MSKKILFIIVLLTIVAILVGIFSNTGLFNTSSEPVQTLSDKIKAEYGTSDIDQIIQNAQQPSIDFKAVINIILLDYYGTDSLTEAHDKAMINPAPCYSIVRKYGQYFYTFFKHFELCRD